MLQFFGLLHYDTKDVSLFQQFYHDISQRRNVGVKSVGTKIHMLIVGVLRHMENSALSLKFFAL